MVDWVESSLSLRLLALIGRSKATSLDYVPEVLKLP